MKPEVVRSSKLGTFLSWQIPRYGGRKTFRRNLARSIHDSGLDRMKHDRILGIES
ncbi:hypothetical protein POX_a00918 [Penicillium oxalicum]|uniref:hypothetical protein n=1 Tax=Penicillium oxalicum TaxID=69781 RepID=UPI0020B65945|nr:hypothetical protein POX_a00918 [Penicillium oxalicum]KAI2794323.1 hypothetical protein POX_a00918 [Penicillium oxalicum]